VKLDVHDVISAGFHAAGIPQTLVEEVLASFEDAKGRFHLSDFRPQAVDGGRFTEGVMRVLEWETTQQFTPLGDSRFKVDTKITTLGNLPALDASDSIRLHIPRAVRLIYDIRNKRNTAHLADGIDPNLQDASLVVATMSWILAELVRIYHAVPADEAQALIEALVQRDLPMIQVFDGRPRILKDMRASDHCLVLLYWVGQGGVTSAVLRSWLPSQMRANAIRTLEALHKKHLVHLEGQHVQLTTLGQRDVTKRQLIAPL